MGEQYIHIANHDPGRGKTPLLLHLFLSSLQSFLSVSERIIRRPGGGILRL